MKMAVLVGIQDLANGGDPSLGNSEGDDALDVVVNTDHHGGRAVEVNKARRHPHPTCVLPDQPDNAAGNTVGANDQPARRQPIRSSIADPGAASPARSATTRLAWLVDSGIRNWSTSFRCLAPGATVGRRCSASCRGVRRKICQHAAADSLVNTGSGSHVSMYHSRCIRADSR